MPAWPYWAAQLPAAGSARAGRLIKPAHPTLTPIDWPGAGLDPGGIDAETPRRPAGRPVQAVLNHASTPGKLSPTSARG